jgi:hypothetical protein
MLADSDSMLAVSLLCTAVAALHRRRERLPARIRNIGRGHFSNGALSEHRSALIKSFIRLLLILNRHPVSRRRLRILRFFTYSPGNVQI